jgi:hypothetical protein
MNKKEFYILIFSIFALVLLASCSSKKRPPAAVIVKPNPNILQKALVVGVSDYAGNDNDLSGINIDANGMKSVFSNWGFDVKELQNSLTLEETLDFYAKTLKAEDVFIFYYSGHGSFTFDKSGDEDDDRDEMIVLSDSNTNLYLIDDKIKLMLNKIKARKLIIFDSCNSGSATKRSVQPKGANFKAKYIQAPKELKIRAKASTTPQTSISGEFLYFAACRDDEQSFATNKGSLFTNAFLKKVNLNKSSTKIHQEASSLVNTYFNPVLSASNERLKNLSLKNFLRIN